MPLPVRVRPVLLSAALLSVASSVTGQTIPAPPQLGQDELDLQARANVVQGSGARALGMGGAFLARADDATAASWNPAGLSYLRLPEVSFVYSGSRLDSLEMNAASRKDDRRHGRTPDFFAAAYPFDLGRVSGSAQVSFQRLISFEGERTINETFLDATGQVVSALPSVVASAGGYDVVTLGTGVAVSTNLRVGATINRWFNGYHQTLDRDTLRGGIPGHTTQEFDYDFSAWNLNLGVVWSPHADFNLGLVYKSAFTADVQLNKSRTDLTVPSSSNQASSTDPGMSPITLDFPAAVGVGGSWRPRSRLTAVRRLHAVVLVEGRDPQLLLAAPGPPGSRNPDDLPEPSLSLTGSEPAAARHGPGPWRRGVRVHLRTGQAAGEGGSVQRPSIRRGHRRHAAALHRPDRGNGRGDRARPRRRRLHPRARQLPGGDDRPRNRGFREVQAPRGLGHLPLPSALSRRPSGPGRGPDYTRQVDRDDGVIAETIEVLPIAEVAPLLADGGCRPLQRRGAGLRAGQIRSGAAPGRAPGRQARRRPPARSRCGRGGRRSGARARGRAAPAPARRGPRARSQRAGAGAALVSLTHGREHAAAAVLLVRAKA